MVEFRYTFSLLCVTAAFLWAPPVLADIYTYIDEDGTIHYTNIRGKVRKGHKKKWKRIMKTGPGKAGSVSGRGKGAKRPARDRSKERFHRYDQHIRDATALYHLPESLVRAVIWVESSYDPNVISNVGAQGLMQLMPSVCKDMGVKNPFDPRENIYGGSRLLRVLANRFQGDLVLTLAAYHAGAGAVRKYQGIPPYATTRQYIRMVLQKLKRVRAGALDEKAPEDGKSASR